MTLDLRRDSKEGSEKSNDDPRKYLFSTCTHVHVYMCTCVHVLHVDCQKENSPSPSPDSIIFAMFHKSKVFLGVFGFKTSYTL